FAVALPDDADLDAFGCLEPLVNDRRARIRQVVDDDVVAALQVERVGNDVLALAGREEQSDLVIRGVDQPGESVAYFVGLAQHLADAERAVRPGLEPGAAGPGD